MSSDWPSALEPKQSYSLERSPVGIQSPSDVVSTDEQNSDFVRNATSDLASRVKSLQKSYEDYLEVQQVDIFSLFDTRKLLDRSRNSMMSLAIMKDLNV